MKTENGHIKIPYPPGCVGDTYDIDLDRINSHQDLVAWVAHLGEKNWVTALMLRKLCLIVCNAKGWGYPSTTSRTTRRAP